MSKTQIRKDQIKDQEIGNNHIDPTNPINESNLNLNFPTHSTQYDPTPSQKDALDNAPNSLSGSNPVADKNYVDNLFQGATWQDPVLDKDLTTPPPVPQTGDRYLISSPATGAWAGHDYEVAEYNGSSWDFLTPENGWIVPVIDEDIAYIQTNDMAPWSWKQMTGVTDVTPGDGLSRIGQQLNVGAGAGIQVNPDDVEVIYDTDNPLSLGTASPGTSNEAARGDHVHAHGNQGRGSQHTAATATEAGFLSAQGYQDLQAVTQGGNADPYHSHAGASPVSYDGILYVIPGGNTGAITYPTIAAAMTVLKNKPIGLRPISGKRYLLVLGPGDYNEQVFLEPNVFVKSLIPGTVRIFGGPSIDSAGMSVISMANSGIKDIIIDPKNFVAAPWAGLWVRSSTTIYSRQTYWNFTFPIPAGTTIHVTPQGYSKEIITLSAQANNINDLVTNINSQSINFKVYQFDFNRLTIYNNYDRANLGVTLHKEGTINPYLGFYTDEDEVATSNPTEFVIAENVFIFNGSGVSIGKGLQVDDQGGGHYNAFNITIDGQYGSALYVNDGIQPLGGGPGSGTGRNITITNLICKGHTVQAVYCGNYTTVKLVGGGCLSNVALPNADIAIANTAILIRNGFSYRNRALISGSEGQVIPSGTTLTFQWHAAGTVPLAGSYFGGPRVVPFDCTIESITLFRGAAGNSGVTQIDLHASDGQGGAWYSLYNDGPFNDPPLVDSAFPLQTVYGALPDPGAGNPIVIPKGMALMPYVLQRETVSPQNLCLTVILVVA